jgi:hypothetical protein
MLLPSSDWARHRNGDGIFWGLGLHPQLERQMTRLAQRQKAIEHGIGGFSR